jgi:hypothetical protein
VLDTEHFTEGVHGLKLDFTAVTPTARAVWYHSENLDWSPYGSLILDVYNPTDLPGLKLGIAITTTDRYLEHEAYTEPLAPGWNRDIRIDLKAPVFSSAASDYKPVGHLVGRGEVKGVSLHLYPGSATAGWITVDNLRLERAGLLSVGDFALNTTLDLTASGGRIDYLPPGMRIRSSDVSTVESFESGPTWTTSQPDVAIASTRDRVSTGSEALAVRYPASPDGFNVDLPGMETRLAGVRQLRLDVWCDGPSASIQLDLYDTDWNEYRTNQYWISHGWNTVIFDFTNQNIWEVGVMTRDVTSRLAWVSVRIRSRWPGRLVFDGLATAGVSLRGAAKPGVIASGSWHPTQNLEAVVDARLEDTWYGRTLASARSAGPQGRVEAGHVRWDESGFRTTAFWRRRVTAMDQPIYLLISPWKLGHEITGAETAGRLFGNEIQALAVSRLEYATYNSRVPTGLGPERVGAVRVRRNITEGTRLGATYMEHLSSYPGTVGEVPRQRGTTGLDAESHLESGKFTLNASVEGAYTSGPVFRDPSANAPPNDRFYGATSIAPGLGRLSLSYGYQLFGYDFDGDLSSYGPNWGGHSAGATFILEGLPGLKWLSEAPVYDRTLAKDLKVSAFFWNSASRDRFESVEGGLKPRTLELEEGVQLANDYQARPNYYLTVDRTRFRSDDYQSQETEERLSVRVPLWWELVASVGGELSQTADRDFASKESGTGWRRIVNAGLERYFKGNLYVHAEIAWRRNRSAWEGKWEDATENARVTAGLRQTLGPNSLIQVDFGQPALYGTDFGSRDTLNVVTVLLKTYI